MRLLSFTLTLFFIWGCQSTPSKEEKSTSKTNNESLLSQSSSLDTATFAGGCFWCVEASFEQIIGVKEAVSGYAGGEESTADYKLVSSGRTQHAEAVQVYFDPSVITFDQLLDIFFTAHDPTQLNRQGPDVGPQYRSAIFYHDQEQLRLAKEKMDILASSFSKSIVTELNPYTKFYEAEAYHQDYEEKNPYNPYIMNVSRPKINKVKEKFSKLLKEEYRD